MSSSEREIKLKLMSQRYLPSIFPECDKLKQAYDKCFTNFFQNYLNSDNNYRIHRNPCSELFAVYQKCVEKKLEKDRPYEIDLEEIRKDVLNQEADCFIDKK